MQFDPHALKSLVNDPDNEKFTFFEKKNDWLEITQHEQLNEQLPEKICPAESEYVRPQIYNAEGAKKAKFGAINGSLKVNFTQITTTQGFQIPINGVIKTNDGSGLLVGGTKVDVAKEYAKDMAVVSAAGALSGLVFGALAGGSAGQGAALGTAVGAGGGLIKAGTVKGNDVVIPVNSSIDLVLTQPITVQPSAYSYEE